jgi:hypothetical protein
MNRARLSRPIYILARFAEMLIAAGSRVINAAVFGGSTHQTTSARAFIDGITDAKWAKRQRAIDRVFFFQPDHCERAWAAEVTAAHKTLARAGI